LPFLAVFSNRSLIFVKILIKKSKYLKKL